jgi:hypothetical protein
MPLARSYDQRWGLTMAGGLWLLSLAVFAWLVRFEYLAWAARVGG